MTVRHPKSRGEGFDPSSDKIITGNWSFTGSLTIPAASVIAQQGAVDHDQLKNFDQAEHFTMSQISITASQVSDLSAAGGLQNIVEDLSPQLGGDLDGNDQRAHSLVSVHIKEKPAPQNTLTAQGQHWVDTADKAPQFTDSTGRSSRIPRLDFAETITQDWTHNASLIMATSQILKWQDAAAVERDIMVLNSAEVAGAAIGHIITKLNIGVTTTSATYVSAAGALVAFSAMEANTDYAVMVRAYVGNATSSVTPQNKVRLAKGGVEVANSEHVFESPNTVINSLGMLYEWGGIINSGASGDLQLQHLSGNGSDICFVNDVVIMMIKVDDLGLNTNIFHDTDNSLVELDDGNFPPTNFFDLGASVTIGNGDDDYLVFGSIKVTDFTTGGNTVTMHVTDGTEIKSGSVHIMGDFSDQLTLGFWQLWKAPAASTILTVKARGTGFPVDKVGASIIAIRLNAFLDYQGTVLDTTPNLGNGPTDIATVAYITSGAGDYGFLGGATGPSSASVGASQLIRNNLNEGGDVTIAGDETQKVIANTGTTDQAQIAISVDQALSAGDTIDADYHAPDADTSIVWFNGFLAVFQWTLVDSEPRLNVGNPLYTTRHLGREHRFFGADGADYVEFKHTGTDFDISGFQTTDINITNITAINAGTVDADFDALTSESLVATADITGATVASILAGNLVDKTAAEAITGAWTVEDNFRLLTDIVTATPPTNEAVLGEYSIYDADNTDSLARFGFVGVNILFITNKMRSGPVRITGRHADGTESLGFVFDPNSGTSLFHNGAVALITVAGEGIAVTGPITATSYDGILAANLLDKITTEDITGSWTFSVGPTFFSAGTVGAPGRAFVGDSDTGTFSPGANIFAITVGGTEAVRYTGASAPLIRTGMNSGVTASTTQTQAGATPLTASWNEVAVVANNNDAVVLPSMVKGETCVVINSSAKKLQVFPALGKDGGAGIDASVSIKANSSRYWFHYDDVVGFDIATEFKSLQGVDTIGVSTNDLLYFDGVDWKHTNGDLTWDGVTLRAVILKPVKYVQHRTASTANLNDITHAVNTDPGKVEGAQVFNTNLNTPVWAKGSADGDKWVNGIGIVIHDPV